MRRTPWVDVALLLVLLLAQRSVLGLDHGTFTSDEGAYASQAIAVADGHWAVDDRFLADSPDGGRTSYVNATVADDGRVFPAVKHPLWPIVLAAGYEVGGEGGLYVVPLLFALAVPLVAWRVASVLLGSQRGGARVAFWAAAVSPAVLVNGHVLWAHSASALAAGLAVLGIVEARRRPGPWPIALAAAGAGAGTLLRSEGLLLAGGLAAASLLGAVLDRRRRWSLVPGMAVAVAGVAGFVVNSAWRAAIAGEPDRLAARGGDGGGSWLGDAASGAVHDLIGDQARSGRFGVVALAVVACAAVLFGLRARRDLADAPRFAVAAVGALAVAWAVAPGETVTGFAAAWPIGVAGLVALRLPDRADERLLLITAGLFTAAVLATSYDVGGGLQWGGRFLSPLTVIAAVGAASLTPSLLAANLGGFPQGFAARTGVVRLVGAAACVVIAGFATTAMRGTRGSAEEAETAIARADAPVALTTNEFLPNILWRTRDSTDWIVVGDDGAARSLEDAVDAMAAADVDRFVGIGVDVDDLAAAGSDVVEVDGAVVLARVPAEP